MQQRPFDTVDVCNYLGERGMRTAERGNISARRDPAAAAVWNGNTQHEPPGVEGASEEEEEVLERIMVRGVFPSLINVITFSLSVSFQRLADGRYKLPDRT